MRERTISERVKVCGTLGKTIGLMFSRRKKDFCLIFPMQKNSRARLHMMFVFYPIDVILLDSDRKIIETTTLYPFTFYTSKNKAKYVIELRSGITREMNLKIGNEISWRRNKLLVIEKNIKN